MSDPWVIVVGGGAAGFFAAIACAEKAPERRVLVLEKGAEVLAKVRISGGGRCNVTHACFDPALLVKNYPRGAEALRGPFTRFQPRDAVAWFAARGVALKTVEDGSMFPVTDRSETIINCFRNAAAQAGVEVQTNVEILSIAREETGFVLVMADGRKIPCRRLLLATGSGRDGYRWAHDLGHTIEIPVPSLFTFNVPNDPRLNGLSGLVAENARISLRGTSLSQTGPLLITHWGFSGPAALKLSAWGARVLHESGYKARLEVRWISDISREDVARELRALKQAHPKKQVASVASFGVQRRLWERLAAAVGIPSEKRWADASAKELDKLCVELTAGLYVMDGKGAFKEEFVTCGGVNLDEVDFRTMESRIRPGLHFAGEILDIDGVTGGFNFQNAWTTGWLAGQAMASNES
jgi:predicted Rossmann fold flavoprotein